MRPYKPFWLVVSSKPQNIDAATSQCMVLPAIKVGYHVQIWVDADACPKAVKQVLFRAAERLAVTTTLVANQFIATPASKFISSLQVPAGLDVADDLIVEKMNPGDLVVTADIPLADQVITKGGWALNPRGMLYTTENIKDHLSRRDMFDELRTIGAVSGGPNPLGKKDVQAFANALDRFLAQHAR